MSTRIKRMWLRVRSLMKTRACKLGLVCVGIGVLALTKPSHVGFIHFLSRSHPRDVEKLQASALSYLHDGVRSSRYAQSLLARFVQYIDCRLFALAKFNKQWWLGLLGNVWLQLPSALGDSVDSLKGREVGLDINSLAAANIGVFALWQILGGESSVMQDNFTASKANAIERPHSLLLASFSHASPLHLISNLQSLLTVGPQVQAVLGPHNTAILYFFSGVCGSTVSVLLNSVLRQRSASSIRSQGASTSIFGIMAFHSLLNANAEFIWYGGIVLTAPQLMVAQLVLDTAAYSQSGIDVFGHAGGALGGAAYFYNMTQAARSIPLLSR